MWMTTPSFFERLQMNAFDRLHQDIREAIFRQQWDALRPLQVETIHALFDTQDHLILSAATASGKTEAAFLPVLTKIAEASSGSVQALYVSPLKALINDQFRRLEILCEQAQIPVHRWHGDVAAREKRLLKNSPNGVLLITPESLESQFINHGRDIRHLYHGLQYVVIDELHAFLEDVRGIHLLSLLCRLKHAAGCSPRLLGLSATLADFSPAKKFLCLENPEFVRVIEDVSEIKEKRVTVKAYQRPATVTNEDDAQAAEKEIAADIASRFRSSTNLIFCNSRSLSEELTDLLDSRSKEEGWARNPFRIHHGSLSRELREEAESELKGTSDISVLCTRTLEMGIDVGAVRAVGQVGAPWSVSSLTQRVGRCGRREGEPQVLRIYAISDEVTTSSSISARLHPELVRTVAMVELLKRKWVESPDFVRQHYSTCIHQVLSVLRQTGGIKVRPLFNVLCAQGAFRSLSLNQFVELLRELVTKGLVEQMVTDEIILAPGGEKIVEARDFYAAFVSTEEFSVEHGMDRIGLLPVNLIPPPGEHIILGGRRWVVIQIEPEGKRVLVEPSRGRKAPSFLGSAGDLSQVVMEEMACVLRGTESPRYLHQSAQDMLVAARQNSQQAGLDRVNVLATAGGMVWFPWAGTKIHRTLQACAKSCSIDVSASREGLALHYSGISSEGFQQHLEDIRDNKLAPSNVNGFVNDIAAERFDEFVPKSLLLGSYEKDGLDFTGASAAATKAIVEIRTQL